MLRGQDPGNKRSQRPPPSSTLEMLPLDGALAHLRPTACKTGRVPVRTRQLAKGKSNRSSFPQAPFAPAGPARPAQRSAARPAGLARRSAPARGRAGPPAARAEPEDGAEEDGGRAGGRTRRGHTHRRADPGSESSAAARSCRASARTEPGAGPHRGGPLRPQREGTRGGGGPAPGAAGAATMIALFNKLLDWFKALFWKEEMELTLVGLQYSGKTTFVNVIAVRPPAPSPRRAGLSGSPPGVEARGLARPRGPGGARPGRDGTEGAGGARGTGDAAQARDWRLRGCHEARGTAARGDGPPSAPQPGA